MVNRKINLNTNVNPYLITSIYERMCIRIINKEIKYCVHIYINI